MTTSSPCAFGARLLQLLAVACFSSVFTTLAFAATSSPTLLSTSTSTRAIALESVTLKSEPFGTTSSVPFGPDRRTRIALFATNLDLLVGEGANAFTSEAEDGAHKHYPLAVEYVGQVPGFEGVYMIIVRLSDDIGPDVGDVLVRLNLHGVSSNRVRFAIGHVGGGPADDNGAVPTPAPDTPPAPNPGAAPNPYTDPAFATAQDTVRFLEQSTFGPTPSLIARVRSIGYAAWLNEQFTAPYTSSNQSDYDYPSLPLYPATSSVGCPTGSPSTCARDNYTMYPVQVQFYKNALYGQDQLRQRVAFALSQILVVSGTEVNLPSWMTPYLQILHKNAFGNYRQLLYEMTLNPGMGRYLDTVGNSRTNPNENYAREIMQLFSIGLFQMNNDGTYKYDAQSNLIPTYDQAIVTNFARVFTGWNFAPQKIWSVDGVTPVINYTDPMRLGSNAQENPANHDFTAKTLLNGYTIPARTSSVANAYQDLNDAIDNIFNHPNVGPFVSRQLIQHLVTSNPSPAYVGRVAAVFNANRSNPNQLQEVVKAILLDPEARGDVKTDPNYGHLREPVQFITNLLRAMNATSDGVISGGASGTTNYPVTMDQDLFRPPTVFNYYSPDYQIPGTSNLGPEFQIFSATTALKRANFANTIVFGNGINLGNTQNPPPVGTTLDFSALEALSNDPAAMVDYLNQLMMHGTMTDSMRTSIINAVSGVTASNAGSVGIARRRAQQALYLVITSSQYQIER